MKTWILITIGIVLALGLLYLFTSSQTEGFLTVDPDTVVTQRRLLQAEGERRYNDLARVQSPLTQIPADEMNAVVSQSVPAPSSNSASLLSMLGFTEYTAADDGSNKQGYGVEQTGMVQQKINFCESLTTIDCDLLNDPRMAECGFCHKNGINSKGKPHRGGMYISSDDQIRENEKAGEGGKAFYNPTFGSCKPINFTLMQQNCVARENNLECERAGAATDDNKCGQCFGSSPPGTTGLLYMGPDKLQSYTATLWVSHPGSHSRDGFGTIIQVDGKTYQLKYSNQPDIDPVPIAIEVKEGSKMSITIYGVPRFWCAWLTNQTGKRSVGINLGESGMTPDNSLVIAGGSNSSALQRVMNATPNSNDWIKFKKQVPSNVLWYQRRKILKPAISRAYYGNGDGTYKEFTGPLKAFAAAGMDGPANPANAGGFNFLFADRDEGGTLSFPTGSVIKAAIFSNKVTMNVTVPASLVEPYYLDDNADCPSGPIILTGTGAALMGANSCFAADGTFAPTLGCIRMLFTSAGGLPAGTLYPKTEAEAKALAQKDPTTGKLALDATTAYLNNLTNIAWYGVDSNGGPVRFKEQKDASMKMRGVSLNNPCDGPLSQTGPHSPECLDYLWRTSGDKSLDGQPIDMDKIPYSKCAPNGLLAPLNPNGTANQTNVDFANNFGPVPVVRDVYTYIFNMTKPENDFPTVAAGMRNCYNVNLPAKPDDTTDCPVPTPSDWQCFGPNKMKQPEVFYVTTSGYNTPKEGANSVCQAFGARVASTEELTQAQLMGADWCATGWVSDSKDAKYTISTTVMPGCGGEGIQSYTPGLAGVNCFGKKPAKGVLSTGVAPFNQSDWSNPHSQSNPPQISFFPAINPSRILRHAGFQMWTQAGNIYDDLYQKDSSFQIMPANNRRAGYVSFQSVNFQGHYIRHAGFRCYLQRGSDSVYNDDSSFKIVQAVNKDQAFCSIQSSNFPDYYMAPLSAANPNDVWITKVNKNDPTDMKRACWKRTASLLEIVNQPFKENKILACKQVSGRVVCSSNEGKTPMLFTSEDECNRWANPIDSKGNQSASATYTVAVPPPQTVAAVIDQYMRRRV